MHSRLSQSIVSTVLFIALNVHLMNYANYLKWPDLETYGYVQYIETTRESVLPSTDIYE